MDEKTRHKLGENICKSCYLPDDCFKSITQTLFMTHFFGIFVLKQL